MRAQMGGATKRIGARCGVVVCLLVAVLAACAGEVRGAPVGAEAAKADAASAGVNGEGRGTGEGQTQPFERRDGDPRGRLGVCLTGQLGRLELESKINNFLAPMREVYTHIDVALVLSNGTSVFVNEEGKGNASASLYPSAEAAKMKLKATGMVNLVYLALYQPPENPMLDSAYVQQLNKNFTGSLLMRRARGHVTQWSMLLDCARMLWNMEARGGSNYRAIARLREDAFFPEKVQARTIAQTADEGFVVVSTCDSWSGMNDKAAVFPRRVASTFFTAPIEEYYRRMHNTVRARNVDKPESFLFHVLSENGLRVQSVHPRVMVPIPYRILDGNGSYCLKLKTGCPMMLASEETQELILQKRCQNVKIVNASSVLTAPLASKCEPQAAAQTGTPQEARGDAQLPAVDGAQNKTQAGAQAEPREGVHGPAQNGALGADASKPESEDEREARSADQSQNKEERPAMRSLAARKMSAEESMSPGRRKLDNESNLDVHYHQRRVSKPVAQS
uniref:Uncharacterized protein n=1 Tax=Erythrolobus australicus TaxID=1077150 RepID=A0A7S1TLQ0_9RHOD